MGLASLSCACKHLTGVRPKIPLVLGNTIGRALQQYNSLEFHLYTVPNLVSGDVTLYEDDALTTAYVTGAYSNTQVQFKRTSKQLQIQVGTPTGLGYAAMPSQRDYTFRYTGSPPLSVTINGASVPFAAAGGTEETGWCVCVCMWCVV